MGLRGHMSNDNGDDEQIQVAQYGSVTSIYRSCCSSGCVAACVTRPSAVELQCERCVMARSKVSCQTRRMVYILQVLFRCRAMIISLSPPSILQQSCCRCAVSRRLCAECVKCTQSSCLWTQWRLDPLLPLGCLHYPVDLQLLVFQSDKIFFCNLFSPHIGLLVTFQCHGCLFVSENEIGINDHGLFYLFVGIVSSDTPASIRLSSFKTKNKQVKFRWQIDILLHGVIAFALFPY